MSMSSSRKPPITKPMRSMGCPSSTTVALAAALAVARAHVHGAGRGSDLGRWRHRRRCGAGWGPGTAGRLLQQPVERETEKAGARASVDHDLRDVRVDIAHGIDIETITGHLRRFLVLAELRGETVGV